MSQRSFWRATGVVTVALMAACGGGKPDQPPAVTSPSPSAPFPGLAPLTIERLDLDRTSFDGGQATNATVFLSRQAPLEATTVSLSSSDPGVATVPASITVPAGQGTATFQVTTREVDGDTPVKITATIAGQPPRDASLSVNTSIRLESFGRVSPYVRGGTRGSLTIRLPARASRRLVMRIDSTNPNVFAPQTATIEPGIAVFTLEFSTPPVVDDVETMLSTTVGGQPWSQQIVLNPPPSIEFTNNGAGTFPSGRTRFDASNGLFRSTTCCRASQVLADVNYGFGNGYLLYFRAPKDTVINPGTYESAGGFFIPGFSLVSDRSQVACSAGGTSRVTVKRASFQPNGVVNRFVATFDQSCTNGGSVSGEISLDATAPPANANLQCSC